MAGVGEGELGCEVTSRGLSYIFQLFTFTDISSVLIIKTIAADMIY